MPCLWLPTPAAPQRSHRRRGRRPGPPARRRWPGRLGRRGRGECAGGVLVPGRSLAGGGRGGGASSKLGREESVESENRRCSLLSALRCVGVEAPRSIPPHHSTGTLLRFQSLPQALRRVWAPPYSGLDNAHPRTPTNLCLPRPPPPPSRRPRWHRLKPRTPSQLAWRERQLRRPAAPVAPPPPPSGCQLATRRPQTTVASSAPSRWASMEAH